MTREERYQTLLNTVYAEIRYDDVGFMFDYIDYLLKENQRLREALEDVERDQAYDGANTLDIVRQALEGVE